MSNTLGTRHGALLGKKVVAVLIRVFLLIVRVLTDNQNVFKIKGDIERMVSYQQVASNQNDEPTDRSQTPVETYNFANSVTEVE